MSKNLTICGNHKLGCDCTNWDEYRIDKERKNMDEKDLLYDVFLNAIENCYNEKDDAQIIEDAENLYQKLAKVIQTVFWDEWDEEYLIDEFDVKKL